MKRAAPKKDLKMRNILILAALASTVTACNTPKPPEQGLASVHVPVVSSSDYVYDAATPSGSLSPEDAGRLDGWFSGLGLDYGDTIYVNGDYAPLARAQVAEIAGRYGMLISQGAPASAGVSQPGALRVVVSRRRASVPGCPDWSSTSNPNFSNSTFSNYGCGVNVNLAAQVANPEDLLHGRQGKAAEDAETAAKAIIMYRNWPLTAILPGQILRPLKSASPSGKKDDK